MDGEGDPARTEDRAVDQDFINSLSSDALYVMRLDLVISALFLTGVGLLFQESSEQFILRVVGSPYTNIGFQFLLGSMLASAYMYFRIRKIGTLGRYPDKGYLKDEKILSYSVAAAVLGSALSMVSLFIGILDGASEGTVPLFQASALFFPLWLIIALFAILSLPDLILDQVEKFREWRAGR